MGPTGPTAPENPTGPDGPDGAPTRPLAPRTPRDAMHIGQPSHTGGFNLRASGVEAWARLTALAIRSIVRSVVGAAGDLFRSRAERARRSERRRIRTAEALAVTLGRLKGAFVKAGQFASVRHDLLSHEVSETLSVLQDRVPPIDIAAIRSMVEEELGASMEDLFAEFDPEPIGAASIAQVHRARLPDGTAVAVKVQYPWIARSLEADLSLLRRLLSALLWWSGRSSVDRDRLFDEFAAGLEEELDFRREADVARRIARNLADQPRVVVPEIVDSRSSARVLTMTFYEAVRIDDLDALSQLGIEPGDLLEVLARAYASQVFVDGLFHADPHPGNLFALAPERPGEPARLLFVDFGLSKHLDPELRREMRLGLYALIQRDLEGFVGRMDAMGMIAPGARPGVHAAVARMFDRIGESGGAAGPLGIAGGQVLGLKDQAVALLRETPGLQLPNDLLLYAKTLSYLFALGERMDPEVDLVKVTLPDLLRFLARTD